VQVQSARSAGRPGGSEAPLAAVAHATPPHALNEKHSPFRIGVGGSAKIVNMPRDVPGQRRLNAWCGRARACWRGLAGSVSGAPSLLQQRSSQRHLLTGVVNVVGIRLDYSRTKRNPKRARNLYAMQATLGMMRKIHKASRIAQLHGVHGHAHPGGGDRGGARH
jgi:hypothetical protein